MATLQRHRIDPSLSRVADHRAEQGLFMSEIGGIDASRAVKTNESEVSMLIDMSERERRLYAGECPVHGRPMGQIDTWYEPRDGSPEYTVVECVVPACTVRAKRYKRDDLADEEVDPTWHPDPRDHRYLRLPASSPVFSGMAMLWTQEHFDRLGCGEVIRELARTIRLDSGKWRKFTEATKRDYLPVRGNESPDALQLAWEHWCAFKGIPTATMLRHIQYNKPMITLPPRYCLSRDGLIEVVVLLTEKYTQPHAAVFANCITVMPGLPLPRAEEAMQDLLAIVTDPIFQVDTSSVPAMAEGPLKVTFIDDGDEE